MKHRARMLVVAMVVPTAKDSSSMTGADAQRPIFQNLEIIS